MQTPFPSVPMFVTSISTQTSSPGRTSPLRVLSLTSTRPSTFASTRTKSEAVARSRVEIQTSAARVHEPRRASGDAGAGGRGTARNDGERRFCAKHRVSRRIREIFPLVEEIW